MSDELEQADAGSIEGQTHPRERNANIIRICYDRSIWACRAVSHAAATHDGSKVAAMAPVLTCGEMSGGARAESELPDK